MICSRSGGLASDLGFEWPIAPVNVSKIARETIKLPITNTAMIGAFLRATEVVEMGSVVEQLKGRFGAHAGADMEAMRRAYNETVLKE